MAEEKVRFQMRIDPDTDRKIKSAMPLANCRSQNEFVETALRFYCDYLTAGDCTAVAPMYLSAIRGMVQDTENRICRLLFKLAVEQDMVMNVLAAGMELPNEQFHAMRGRCVQDVKKPAAVSRWVTLSATRGVVCDHPYPVQILRRKTKNKSPRKK